MQLQLEAIVMDQQDARTKLEEYEAEMAAHKWRLSNVWKQDWREVQRIYKALASGGHFIDAGQAIVKAGAPSHYAGPRLAISKATNKECWSYGNTAHTALFDREPGFSSLFESGQAKPAPFAVLPFKSSFLTKMKAVVPPVPPKHYPKDVSPDKCMILWEAEWTAKAPVDPALLEPIAGINFCRVLAQWDLTDVERMALQARL
jgi:hypothetical protein